jgi:hypothetical protein
VEDSWLKWFRGIIGVLVVGGVLGVIDMRVNAAQAEVVIDNLQEDVVEIKEDVSSIQINVAEIDKRQARIEAIQGSVLERMDSQDTKLDTILRKLE